MALILHLSDLHLGSPSDSQLDITDKFGLPATGETKIDYLRRTIRGLGEALRKQDRTLDAIVVSGDLTNANQPDGYAEFGVFLEELGDRKPADENIVVVPGNHDTDWDLQPGTPGKFRRFLDTVRSGHRSPLIFGLDYDDSNFERRTGSRKKARPLLEFDDVAILALSSADFCGVKEEKTETDWAALLHAYHRSERASRPKVERDRADELFRQAEQDLRRLRVQDMARVHDRQFDALGARLADTSLARPADEDRRLRIAVLHHPIGPVTDHEEVKAFETLTNLAKVRNFLFDHGFHIVLHGHRHESYLGWEWLRPPSDELEAVPWRTLVVGSPGDFKPGKLVCRLLEVCPDGDCPIAGAPRVRLIPVKGIRSGQTVSLEFAAPPLSLAQPFSRSSDTGSPWIVRALTADAAYQQLRDLPTSPAEPRTVISVVEQADSAGRLPENYPEARDDGWLEDLVTWWQLPRPEAVRAFAGSKVNHGERLYGRDGDTVAKAAAALPSSKAFAVLVDASEAGAPALEYPAFSSVQLQARPAGEGTYIDVVGVFRKQDLSLWWPVNMAELRRIQERAIEAAAQNEELKQPARAGRLVSVATTGVHETVLPQMAGTTLDRAIDLAPAQFHRLAYLAANPRPETQREWERALADVGIIEDDVVMVPSIGVERLREAVALQRDLGESSAAVMQLLGAITKLAADAEQAARDLAEKDVVESRAYWGNELRADVDAVLAAVRSRVRAASIKWTK